MRFYSFDGKNLWCVVVLRFAYVADNCLSHHSSFYQAGQITFFQQLFVSLCTNNDGLYDLK